MKGGGRKGEGGGGRKEEDVLDPVGSSIFSLSRIMNDFE